MSRRAAVAARRKKNAKKGWEDSDAAPRPSLGWPFGSYRRSALSPPKAVPGVAAKVRGAEESGGTARGWWTDLNCRSGGWCIVPGRPADGPLAKGVPMTRNGPTPKRGADPGWCATCSRRWPAADGWAGDQVDVTSVLARHRLGGTAPSWTAKAAQPVHRPGRAGSCKSRAYQRSGGQRPARTGARRTGGFAPGWRVSSGRPVAGETSPPRGRTSPGEAVPVRPAPANLQLWPSRPSALPPHILKLLNVVTAR